jgi:hypothetical protein
MDITEEEFRAYPSISLRYSIILAIMPNKPTPGGSPLKSL